MSLFLDGSAPSLANIDVVLADILLTNFVNNLDNEWEWAFADCAALITLLPRLAAVCTVWRVRLAETLQYHALRLAMWDLAQSVGGDDHLAATVWSLRKYGDFLHRSFLMNMQLFSCSWFVGSKLPHRLRVASMAELQNEDLARLRGLFSSDRGSGWGAVLVHPDSAGKFKDPVETVWATLAHRNCHTSSENSPSEDKNETFENGASVIQREHATSSFSED